MTALRASVLLLAIALAAAAAAQEKKTPTPGGPVPVPYPTTRPPSAAMLKTPAMAPDAAALHAKLKKAQADLHALDGLTDKPPNLGPQDKALFDAQQAENRRLAEKLGELARELESGASASDVGQKLQFQLQEANNVYQRSAQAQSNLLKKQSDTANSIIHNLK